MAVNRDVTPSLRAERATKGLRLSVTLISVALMKTFNSLLTHKVALSFDVERWRVYKRPCVHLVPPHSQRRWIQDPQRAFCIWFYDKTACCFIRAFLQANVNTLCHAMWRRWWVITFIQTNARTKMCLLTFSLSPAAVTLEVFGFFFPALRSSTY